MMRLNPWEQLVWLTAVGMIFLPMIAACVAACFNAWYKAKDAHIARVAKALGGALSNAMDDYMKKMEEKKRHG